MPAALCPSCRRAFVADRMPLPCPHCLLPLEEVEAHVAHQSLQYRDGPSHVSAGRCPQGRHPAQETDRPCPHCLREVIDRSIALRAPFDHAREVYLRQRAGG